MRETAELRLETRSMRRNGWPAAGIGAGLPQSIIIFPRQPMVERCDYRDRRAAHAFAEPFPCRRPAFNSCLDEKNVREGIGEPVRAFSNPTTFADPLLFADGMTLSLAADALSPEWLACDAKMS